MLKDVADYIVFTLIGIAPGSRSGEALDFFIYDILKIFLLLTTIIFVVAIIPALVIDGRVIFSGKVASAVEIKGML